MGGESALETLAEVAIALAGFGSLLVVLRRAPESPWQAGEGTDLFIVVGGSLLVLFFALAPLPLFHLGLSEPGVWRLSSALLALGLVAAYVVVLRRRTRLLREGIRPTLPGLSSALAQLPLLLAALLALNAASVLPAPGAGGYLLALVLLLAGSAFPLVSMVAQVGR